MKISSKILFAICIVLILALAFVSEVQATSDNELNCPYKSGENYTFDQVANYMAEPGELGALYNYDSAKKFEEGVLVGQVSGFYPVFVDGEWMYRLIDDSFNWMCIKWPPY